MALVYIQQNGSVGKSIPYTNKTHPNSTIATSGCGCCSSLMVLLNQTSYSMTLKKWASILMKKGAREYDGTDMLVVGKIMKDDYGFEYEHTTDLAKLRAHIKAGYKAVANVGGKGYFSSGGHFVCVAGITKDGKAIVLDPYYYANKWTATVNGIKRSRYFTYNSSTHEVYCDFSTIAADAKAYKYHLFKPTKKKKYLYSAKDIRADYGKETPATPEPAKPAPTPTYKTWTGYTTANTLNIRKKPSADSNILGTFAKGTKVTILGGKGKFYQILYKGYTSYIAKDYVSKTKPDTSWTGVVTASTLNVRAKPSTSSKKLGSLKRGAIVKISGSDGGFYITKYNNKTAYVAKKYIKKK